MGHPRPQGLPEFDDRFGPGSPGVGRDDAGSALEEIRLGILESREVRARHRVSPDVVDARRQQAFPLWREDRTRNPDVLLSGPIRELDETARRRFFGEE